MRWPREETRVYLVSHSTMTIDGTRVRPTKGPGEGRDLLLSASKVGLCLRWNLVRKEDVEVRRTQVLVEISPKRLQWNSPETKWFGSCAY